MEREIELKLGMYLSTKFCCFLGEQVNLITIEHEVSYDEAIRLARTALELNLSIYREASKKD
jgi:hypothetical protein